MSPEEREELKSELRELKRARRSGVKRVVFGERDVTYKSDDDMRQAQREIEQELAEDEVAAGVRQRRRSRSVIMIHRRN